MISHSQASVKALPLTPLQPLWRPARWLSPPPCALQPMSASHSTLCHCPPAGGSTQFRPGLALTQADRLERENLTPIPPQGRTAYIFWLIGPGTKISKSRGYGTYLHEVLDTFFTSGNNNNRQTVKWVRHQLNRLAHRLQPNTGWKDHNWVVRTHTHFKLKLSWLISNYHHNIWMLSTFMWLQMMFPG